MIPRPKELASCPGPKGANQGLEVSQGSNFEKPEQKKAARRSMPPESASNRSRPSRAGYFPCFAYQSALMGVKLFHFSGRSSSAKIAVTGQTGTHAPQSMHSVGWIYSCVSLSKFASSLRGRLQSTGQTSTQAVHFLPL